MPSIEEAIKIQEERRNKLLDISDNYVFYREFYNFALQTNPKIVKEYKEWNKRNDELIERVRKRMGEDNG